MSLTLKSVADMFLGIVGVLVSKKINIKTDSIQIGDLLHYCPADLSEESHDVGIIYEILNEDNKKSFKVCWSRNQDYDVYSETTLSNKLNKMISKQNMMRIIKEQDAQP